MNDKDFMDVVRKRMQDAVDFDRENREEALDDLENIIGLQWPDDIRKDREAESRPVLTINRLPQFLRQVTGDIRRLNPAINVIPGDNEASEDGAEIFKGLVRHIQQDSDASSVYEWAAESAAACGIGAFRVSTDWVDDNSFLQEIKVKFIRNPLSVYFDPFAELPTREDAEYCFITSDMARDAFETAYPDKSVVDAEADGEVEGVDNWYNKDSLTVAEYYWKEPIRKKLGLLENGQVVEDPKPPLNVVRERIVETHKVMWAKVSGLEILEGPKEVPCSYIPVVAVTGEEWAVGDRVYRSGVVRFAKDPQRLYNYWRSAETEMVALQPKAPFLVTPKQVQGFEGLWESANNANHAYLPYNPDERAAGAPQRATPPVSSQGMMQQVLSAAEDMKATTGIYDAALGNQSNENSGVAIRQRQMESDISTSIYSDNMAKGIELCGRIIVDMIPQIYDTARIVRVIDDDEKEQMVPVNGVQMTQDGPMPINPLNVGKYDVKVTVGPNYATRRQEAAESMIEFIRVVPGAAQAVGDLIAENMDWPDADKFAERLKKLLPPGMLPPETPEEQQAMQQQMANQQRQTQIAEMGAIADIEKVQSETRENEADAFKKFQEGQRAALGI